MSRNSENALGSAPCSLCGRTFKSNAGLFSHIHGHVRKGDLSHYKLQETLNQYRVVCKSEGCDSWATIKELCHVHYQHLRHYGKVIPSTRPLHGRYGAEMRAKHGVHLGAED